MFVGVLNQIRKGLEKKLGRGEVEEYSLPPGFWKIFVGFPLVRFLFSCVCRGFESNSTRSGKEIGEGGGRGIQLAARLLENFCRGPFG